MSSHTKEMQQFTVGASEGCDVLINAPSIGRTQSRIYFTKETVLIEDLDSKQGTYVFHENRFKRIKSAKIHFETLIRFGIELGPMKAQDIIDQFKNKKEKEKLDILSKVKKVGLKRCGECGHVLEKTKIHCDCCGAIFK